jgi:hypothetical protein
MQFLAERMFGTKKVLVVAVGVWGEKRLHYFIWKVFSFPPLTPSLCDAIRLYFTPVSVSFFRWKNIHNPG